MVTFVATHQEGESEESYDAVGLSLGLLSRRETGMDITFGSVATIYYSEA
jgi:hypothetical protein